MSTVAVSGINAVDNPGPGTGVARCLKECDLDVRLIGLAYDTLEPGIYMDWLFDKSYILLTRPATHQRFSNGFLIFTKEKKSMSLYRFLMLNCLFI